MTAAVDIGSGPFPESPRVIYRKNPLGQVVCQLRFPPVLRIETELPAAFQERIRSDYPILRQSVPADSLQLPPNVPEALVNMLRSAVPKRQVAYDFVAPDDKWAVGLTREFLALTSTNYRRWEQFEDHLSGPVKALLDVYSPVFFSRVGLRYQDVITRSELGLGDIPWAELLHSHISGVLSSSELQGSVDGVTSQALVKFPKGPERVLLRYGLIERADTKEECFLIDSDFYTEERIGTDNVIDTLRHFNQQSGRLFRWCITEKLHLAMDPGPIEQA